MDVKIEIGNEICPGCLSQNRKMCPVGELEIFYNSMLRNTFNFNRSGASVLKMCWECTARLKSFKHFSEQLFQAQVLLMNVILKVDSETPTLSNLSIVINKTYNQEYNHDTITKITDNPNITDNDKIKIKPTIKNTVTRSKPNKISVELEPIIKQEKVTDFYTKQYYDNDDDYYDNETSDINELLPDLFNDSIVKELYNKDKKVKEKKYKTGKLNNSNMYGKCYTIKKGEEVDIKDYKQVDNYFSQTCLDEKEIEELVHKVERETNSSYKFRCEVCKLPFLSDVDYKRHVSLFHHEHDKPNRCVLCKTNLPTLKKLRQHWKMNHSVYYQCRKCSEYVRKNVRVQHLKYRHRIRFCCKGCKRDFPTRNAFFIHYKKEHGRYTCDYCGKICLQKRVLIKHIDHNHIQQKCKICCKTFLTFRNYMAHMTLHHPELIKKKVDKESAFCVECNRQFPSVAKYRKHISDSVKHGFIRKVVNVPCPECGKIFKRAEYMKNHLYQVHMPEKAKFYCAICNKVYANSWGLKVHNRNIHLKVPKRRDKICDLCGRGFTENNILANHRRTHTGERPFKCEHCSASFTQKVACLSHMKTQHKDIIK